MLMIAMAIIAFLVVGGVYVSGVRRERSVIETGIDATQQIEDIQNMLNAHGEQIKTESQE
ncbi:MAG: hypothetical protein UY53_C0001G0047 [Parcubacteria group bacterium GW2011_GWA2_50_10]|nr:MAG: hypothetical protein UY25_C0003G0023 [Candidatus Yanofskybacteria bacterium GW2011_GWC1_48_11]KKW08402.1 MAG: hypothetical protein UY45_C0007G0025 [Parcubacteria group bacterium GW2011_GWA1_49_26]KKW14331.1 MAG: hypothetical protein UY53_C0001G0047 [Parcubacteria group bacterium GW2011_GWA2_50_10]